MESTTQRVQYCRKNRLEGWILLFYAKTERKHPGTRLDVMREIAGFWYDKKKPQKMSIKGKCRLYGRAVPRSIHGFEDRFTFMQVGGKNTSADLKTIERVRYARSGSLLPHRFVRRHVLCPQRQTLAGYVQDDFRRQGP